MQKSGWLTLALGLALGGCGSEGGEAAEAETETPAAETAPEETAEAEEAEAEEAAADGEAAAEGEAAADGEGTYCEQAFASIQELRRQMEERMGGENQAPPLDRDAYLASCNELPEGAQQCMILSYAAEHQEDCAQFQEQIQQAQSN